MSNVKHTLLAQSPVHDHLVPTKGGRPKKNTNKDHSFHQYTYIIHHHKHHHHHLVPRRPPKEESTGRIQPIVNIVDSTYGAFL